MARSMDVKVFHLEEGEDYRFVEKRLGEEGEAGLVLEHTETGEQILVTGTYDVRTLCVGITDEPLNEKESDEQVERRPE